MWGTKVHLCVSGVRECWKGYLGRIVGEFGGFGFDGFEVSGILLTKIIKEVIKRKQSNCH